MRANYRQIPTMLMSESPFEGNSMRAMIPVARDKDGDYISHRGRLYSSRSAQELFKGKSFRYLVLSYGTPIAGITDSGERVFVEDKFSSTTSRHQNLVRAWMREDDD